MDAGGLLLDESDAQEGSENLHKFLTGYAWLAAHFVNKRMMLFLFRPKHHCVFHQAVQLGAWRINQTMFQTTDDESFLGKLKKKSLLAMGKQQLRACIQDTCSCLLCL